MRRREVITLVSGAAATWPLAARKTAKALGREVPTTILLRANEVIE